jgi:hypothetical protein
LHSPSKTIFFFAKTATVLKAFSGADMSRAQPYRVHRRPLTGSTAGITPVVKARVEWGKKWRENDFGQEHRMEKWFWASALIRIDERRKAASQEVANEKTLVGSPQAVKGKVQKGERLLPRSRRAKAGEEVPRSCCNMSLVMIK